LTNTSVLSLPQNNKNQTSAASNVKIINPQPPLSPVAKEASPALPIQTAREKQGFFRPGNNEASKSNVKYNVKSPTS
jgi:hypothetical protein